MYILIKTLEALLVVLVGFFFFRLRSLHNAEANLSTEKFSTVLENTVLKAEDEEASQPESVLAEEELLQEQPNKPIQVPNNSSFAANVDETNNQALDNLPLIHGFISNQLDPIKSLEKEHWCNEASSSFLMGAFSYMAIQFECSSDSIKNLAEKNIVKEHSLQDFARVLQSSKTPQNMRFARSGAKAARLWLKCKSVPDTFSLSDKLESWEALSAS